MILIEVWEEVFNIEYSNINIKLNKNVVKISEAVPLVSYLRRKEIK